MKSVLMSIHPKWCALIASGKKTVEVRKTKPKLQTPFKVYIYCTQGKPRFTQSAFCDEVSNGKVIGEFVCDRIIEIKPFGFDDVGAFEKQTCLTSAEIVKYLSYGWHISDLVIYDEPRELSEFRQVKKIRGYHRAGETMAQRILNGTRVEVSYFTRPPQSWCYVEEVK